MNFQEIAKIASYLARRHVSIFMWNTLEIPKIDGAAPLVADPPQCNYTMGLYQPI